MTVRRHSVASLLIIIAAVIVLSACGLLVLLPGGSTGGTLSTGRSVTAHSDSLFLSSQFLRDTATIRTAGRTIVVKPDVMLVDGRAAASIDGGARSVDVTVKNGAITATVDGEPLPLVLP